jgi:hypothetical protein
MHRPGRRRRGGRRRESIAAVLGRPAPAVAYPGYRSPELEHRTRMAIGGAALLHGTAIAVLFVLASMAPRVEDHVLHLRFVEPEPPPPPPIEVPKPEPPPPPPVRVELPKPKAELPKPPPPKPAPRPVPPKPVVKPPVVKPEPILPAPPIAPIAPVPAPARVARMAPRRESAVQMPAAQIDQMAARPEFADPAPAVTHRPAPAVPRTERAARPTPAALDRVAVARPEAAPAAPAPRAAPPPAPARAERPAMIAPKAAPGPRHQLRGVALSELLPCVSDAREMALKQRTVAAAQNRPLCESPAGNAQFMFAEFPDFYVAKHVIPMLEPEWQSRHPELAQLDVNARFAVVALWTRLGSSSSAGHMLDEIERRYKGRGEMLVGYPIGSQSTLREAVKHLRERSSWSG